MEKIPSLLKKFSKKSQPERNNTFADIKELRSSYFKDKSSDIEEQSNTQNSIDLKIEVLKEELTALNNLKDELEDLQTESYLKNFFNSFKAKSLKKNIDAKAINYKDLDSELKDEKWNLESLKKKINEKKETMRLDSKNILKRFYEEQEKTWIESGYEDKDILENFSEENLSSLSIEDYIMLLKRFPSKMITHVTRQGVRDHTSGEFHTGSMGIFHNGFEEILDDWKLRSSLSISMIEEKKDNAIASFFDLENSTKEEALRQLDLLTGKYQNDPGSFADRTAIHFATEHVANAFYGAESGNEVFMAYPSAHIASNYLHAGDLQDGGGSSKYNDQWIWANEQKGMDLKAGIVFIPKDSQVDKRNGSIYNLDEDNKPKINEKYKNSIEDFITSDLFSSFLSEAKKIKNRSFLSRLTSEKTYHQWEDENKTIEEIAPLIKILERDFSISDEALQFTILNFYNLQELEYLKNSIENSNQDDDYVKEITENLLEKILEEAGVLFQKAENTITSEQYWKDYLDSHNKNDLKVVYYKENDPTEALKRWRIRNKIFNKNKDNSYLKNNHAPKTDSRITDDKMDRFKTLSLKVINEYYPDTN